MSYTLRYSNNGIVIMVIVIMQQYFSHILLSPIGMPLGDNDCVCVLLSMWFRPCPTGYNSSTGTGRGRMRHSDSVTCIHKL